MANRMMKWFEGAHLSKPLNDLVCEVRELAEKMDERLAESAEKTTGLRKLLEAKDCFVRAAIETVEQEDER